MGSRGVPLLRVLREFDPWKGRLCTCPKKFSLSPYTGCAHSCLYCYTSAYIKEAFRPRPKRDFLRRLEADLDGMKPRSLICMSTSSDPYTPPEEELGITRRAIRLILERGMCLLVMTKSDLVVRDLDVLSDRCAVSITVTTLDDRLASIMEPRAPRPLKRIKALEKAGELGVPTILRLDPIIPGVNDDPRSIKEVLDAAESAGVRHVVSSTYKVRPDNMRRMSVLPVRWELYDLGETISGYRYLPKPIRMKILGMVREEVLKMGMTFAVCREGLPLNSPGVHCDGSHLISG